MIKSLEDKRCCPNCGHQLHERPYLMARQATANVLSWTQIAWIVCTLLGLVALGQVL